MIGSHNLQNQSAIYLVMLLHFGFCCSSSPLVLIFQAKGFEVSGRKEILKYRYSIPRHRQKPTHIPAAHRRQYTSRCNFLTQMASTVLLNQINKSQIKREVRISKKNTRAQNTTVLRYTQNLSTNTTHRYI